MQETVAHWHTEGKLDFEYAQLQRILEDRKFTREQIKYCFCTMLPGLALLAVDRDTNELTLDALKKKFGKVFDDEVRTIQVCGVLVDAQTRPETEVLQDLQREVLNELCQREFSEEERED